MFNMIKASMTYLYIDNGDKKEKVRALNNEGAWMWLQ